MEKPMIYINEADNFESKDYYDRKEFKELNSGLHLENINYEVLPDSAIVIKEIPVGIDNISTVYTGVWLSGHPAFFDDSIAEEELKYWSKERRIECESEEPEEKCADGSMCYYQAKEGYFIKFVDDEDGDEDSDDEENEGTTALSTDVVVLSEGFTAELDLSDIEGGDDDFVKITALRKTDANDDFGLPDEIILDYFTNEKEDDCFESVVYLRLGDIRNSPSNGKRVLLPIYAYNTIDYGYHY